MTSAPLPPPTSTAGQPPGWYPDPWLAAPWRWWDGTAWSAHTSLPAVGSAAVRRKPRLPRWLSVPVVVCALPMVPLILITLASSLLAFPLGLIPLAIVGPTLLWLDRVEPEPRSSKVHAFLWGALVATFVALIANETGGAVVGRRFAMVVTAPVFEEAMKALGIMWAVRRREVSGLMDGIIYAGWVALGFAVAEDFFYLVTAGGHSDGQLVAVAIFRTVVTPFAHPLFTAWTGLAVGRAVANRKSPWVHGLWGLALAICCHAAWNGSITAFEKKPKLLLIVAMLFVALFVAAIVVTTRIRKAEKARFLAMVPAMATRYGLTVPELNVFANWNTLRSTRAALDRPKKKAFGSLHGALAQLAFLHHRGGDLDTVEEHVLVDQMNAALAKLR
jgi:protease PrsW